MYNSYWLASLNICLCNYVMWLLPPTAALQYGQRRSQGVLGCSSPPTPIEPMEPPKALPPTNFNHESRGWEGKWERRRRRRRREEKGRRRGRWAPINPNSKFATEYGNRRRSELHQTGSPNVFTDLSFKKLYTNLHSKGNIYLQHA